MAKQLVRWEISYAGSFMGNIDASTKGTALRIAKRRWGGNKSLYGARQTIYLKRNPMIRNFKVPHSGSGIIKLVRKLVRLGRKRKNMKLTVRRVKR